MCNQETSKIEIALVFLKLIMEGTIRKNIEIGMLVNVVLKKNQRSGQLTEGIVSKILTKSPIHPHGIKVKLEDGQVGRVKEIMND